MRCSVIIPTYNRREKLRSLLDSLGRQASAAGQCEIIVVSDGSDDGTGEFLQAVQNEGVAAGIAFRFLEIPNQGPAAARNRGAELADGELLIFTDDDCRAPENWLEHIAGIFEDGGIDAVAGHPVNYVENNAIAVMYGIMSDAFFRELNADGAARYMMTNCFAIRRAVFVQSGGFDEKMKLGAEDRELALRLLSGGVCVVYRADWEVAHYHDFTIRSLARNFFGSGRGSFLLYRRLAHSPASPRAGIGIGGYARLLGALFRGAPSYGASLLFIGAFVLSQFFWLCGFIATAWQDAFACVLRGKTG
jgi:glycosyltransferase involved in cell wall biosynthesis